MCSHAEFGGLVYSGRYPFIGRNRRVYAASQTEQSTTILNSLARIKTCTDLVLALVRRASAPSDQEVSSGDNEAGIAELVTYLRAPTGVDRVILECTRKGFRTGNNDALFGQFELSPSPLNAIAYKSITPKRKSHHIAKRHQPKQRFDRGIV